MDARPEWVRESQAPPKIDPHDHLAVAKTIRDLYRDPSRFTTCALVRDKDNKCAAGWLHPNLSTALANGHSFCLRGARLMVIGYDDAQNFDLKVEDEFCRFLNFNRDCSYTAVDNLVLFNNSGGYEAVCDRLDKAIAAAA